MPWMRHRFEITSTWYITKTASAGPFIHLVKNATFHPDCFIMLYLWPIYYHRNGKRV